ncbi:DUF3459 domain-containing protein, partial [Pseudoalteromonas sp. SIMBA_162]
WLPVPDFHHALAVDHQEHDPASLLNASRELLAFRRRHPALSRGEIHFHSLHEEVICFTRHSGGESLLIALNFSAQALTLKTAWRAEALEDAP